MRGITRQKEPKGRTTFLSDAERDRLLTACREDPESHLYPIVVLALSTGMRRGEILGLTWPDVDLKTGWLVLLHTKNEDRRGVPLLGHALDTIKELSRVRRIGTALVFPNEDGSGPVRLRRAWDRAVATAERSEIRRRRAPPP